LIAKELQLFKVFTMVLNTHKHLGVAGFDFKCARRDVKRMAPV